MGLLSGTAQAQAGLELTCTTEQRTTYSPGVTLFPSHQDIRLDSTFAGCVSPTRPSVTSGSASFSLAGSRSCLALDRTIAGTSRITWNTGETSVYSYSSTTATLAGQIVVTIVGSVTSGPFQGGAITILVASPAVNLLSCLFPPGITSRTGVGTVVIASLR